MSVFSSIKRGFLSAIVISFRFEFNIFWGTNGGLVCCASKFSFIARNALFVFGSISSWYKIIIVTYQIKLEGLRNEVCFAWPFGG